VEQARAVFDPSVGLTAVWLRPKPCRKPRHGKLTPRQVQ
jgi:hypothetical protein